MFLALLVAATRIGSRALEDAPPVLTVCDVLTDVDRYEGRVVVVVGRLGHSDEGVWLDEDCGIKVARAERDFSPSISVAHAVSEFAPPPTMPHDFKWDRRLIQSKLHQVARTTRLRVYKDRRYDDRWEAIFGRLETKLPRQLKIGDDRYGYTNGFGHLSAAPAQLVSPNNGSLRLTAK